MIKYEYLGETVSVKLDNGLTFTATITDDPSEYDFYRSIGLDYVFEKTEKELLMEELDAHDIKYRKNSSVETLQKKLDDSINKGTSKYEYSANVEGEDND